MSSGPEHSFQSWADVTRQDTLDAAKAAGADPLYALTLVEAQQFYERLAAGLDHDKLPPGVRWDNDAGKLVVTL